ncbi:heavy metal-associated isoprenylated plant protein 43-like [Juglans microcarpa x Juglans regia]|uniref:heavy metal-associated isoprenylated plant protein 43-like n=1 Tax=Juglans microcarpa x Juglans regia TaxID=2249226 RepID=UPI001B7F384D|nr:heavy metal-associated isoprenylated plant protein 43-like [Juglans microcarpa x Juglans regia]XP_041017434.1 heavy metal-associated isoprenylated plant protein 43-like [Juglans microcarpa x Juglans regia]
MVQITKLKVIINCLKCKQQLLKAVSPLQGVDKVEVDEANGTLTVTGDADPYEIILRTKKTGKYVDVVSIGPPPAPPKQDKDQKKPDDKDQKKPADPKKPDDQKPVVQYIPMIPPYCYTPHHNCPVCDPTLTVFYDGRWEDPNPSCSIQ